MGSQTALFLKYYTGVIRYVAIVGFIAVTALIVNLNYFTLAFFFKEKTKKFWILFFFMVTMIFLVLVYSFSIIFLGNKPVYLNEEVAWQMDLAEFIIRVQRLFVGNQVQSGS